MADNKQQPKKGKLSIDLPEDVAEGQYSNLAIIAHNHSEFIVDFVMMAPNMPKAKVKSRIILTPHHAKRLMKALADNIKRYEKQFGAIAETNTPPFPTMNFNTPTAQA